MYSYIVMFFIFQAYLKPELLHNEFCHLQFPKRVTQTDVGRSMLYRDADMTGWYNMSFSHC